MTSPEHSHERQQPPDTRPYAMVGAGRQTSAIWKTGDQQSGWRYRFNLFRLSARGRVGQRFCPADVLSLVKLARVLAAALADDNCLPPILRDDLARLAADLDQIIHRED